jgi:hypothetical protein
MIAGVLELLGSGVFGQSDFKDSEEAFFMNSDKSLFTGFPDINNFAFGDVDDLVKTFNFSAEDLSNPKGFIHEALCSLDGNEILAFTKEESESSRHVLS